jgi:hypothetical protein
MTDTPSLGTDKLKFTAEKRAEIMRFSSQDAEVTMFTRLLRPNWCRKTRAQ